MSQKTNSLEDAEFNFFEIATKYGHQCNEYQVVTEDKYVLTLFHIPGDPSRPVLLMHGFLDSADTFIIRAHDSISLTLARERNNDVWVGNMRGNKYSRRHLTLNPDKDKKFWDFSFHEIAYYDLPATIDFILEKTRQSQLQAIGHSVGTMLFYVLGSTRPEYNNKIKILVSLAPIAYLQHTGRTISAVLKYGQAISNLYLAFGMEELLSDSGMLNKALQKLCSNKMISYTFSGDLRLFLIDGSDSEELESDFISIAIRHFTSGTSRKHGLHIAQVSNRKKFAQYDYGNMENLKIYNSQEPPEYDLGRVTMKIALFVARNDRISTIPDTELLIPKLPNVVKYHIMEREKANHMDFVWAKHMDRDLFPYVFKLLDKYN